MSIERVARLDDLIKILSKLPGPDALSGEKVKRHEKKLTKPLGSLGNLEEIVFWLANWQGQYPPKTNKAHCIIFAGNHGVAAQGVSAFPAKVTAQMVKNFEVGGAAINQICEGQGITLKVVPIKLECPTADITQGPAMTEAEYFSAFQQGVSAIDADIDLLCVGEMGIGNTTAAAALSCALFGGDAEDWTGPGTGVSGDILKSKIKAVGTAVSKNMTHEKSSLELGICLGGRELSAIAGAVIAARVKRIPVLFDGYVATAAIAPIAKFSPGAIDHCLAAHLSAEPAHAMLLKKLDKQPILDLGLRLGEASGAALATYIVRMAVFCHTGMATFVEAGVSKRNNV